MAAQRLSLNPPSIAQPGIPHQSFGASFLFTVSGLEMRKPDSPRAAVQVGSKTQWPERVLPAAAKQDVGALWMRAMLP
jgi:hypothetical protein